MACCLKVLTGENFGFLFFIVSYLILFKCGRNSNEVFRFSSFLVGEYFGGERKEKMRKEINGETLLGIGE